MPITINVTGKLFNGLVGRVENAAWLDKVSAAVLPLATPLRRFRAVTDVLSGTPLSHPLHPLLVTVPLGSWIGALGLDLVHNPKGARTLIGLGVLAAVPTVLTGLSDWSDTEGGEQRVGVVHALFNASAFSAFAASYLARRRDHHIRGFLWTLPALSLMGAAGALGGHLSYARGIGVDTTAFQTGDTDWTDLVAEADVRTGALTCAEVDCVAVVLTRTEHGQVVAYADRCTHRGGPLHEGRIVDGCVECPWHGSQFELSDGSVRHGPATRPAPAYQVQVSGGRVRVRRASGADTLRSNPVGG